MIIAPIAAIALGYLILGEPASWLLVFGGVLVIGGVYIGALADSRPAA